MKCRCGVVTIRLYGLAGVDVWDVRDGREWIAQIRMDSRYREVVVIFDGSAPIEWDFDELSNYDTWREFLRDHPHPKL